MSIKINGEDKRIGLALSGGGFRAAGFHLGVMRKLQELKLLDKIDLLSCVSGGSIIGAYLALNWGAATILDDIERYLRTRSIAVGSVIGGLLDPFESRLDKLAETYDRDLFFKKTLKDFPKNGPRIYLNSTNLATGNMFFFVSGGNLDAEIGEHEMGVIKSPTFPICKAVAASSAFPPVFPPLKLDASVYKHAAAIDFVTLTDGGVYDNLGINPALRDRNDLDYLIISDGGKPFANDAKPTESGTIVLQVALDIMMEQIRGLEFDRVEHRHKSKVGPKPLWFSIDSQKGESVPGDASFASSIGTNLKALKDHEIKLLQRHGAALVHSRIKNFANELLN